MLCKIKFPAPLQPIKKITQTQGSLTDSALCGVIRQGNTRVMDNGEIEVNEEYIGDLIAAAEVDEGNGWFKCFARNEDDRGLITTLLQTQTECATHLCIQSPSEMLTQEIDIDIGGTYKGDKQEFWFFGSISVGHGYNYLLKLFVMTHKDAKFSVYIPSNENVLIDQIEINNDDKYAEIVGPTKEFIFAPTNIDEIVYMRTYNFTKENIIKIGKRPLLLPCSLEIHTKFRIQPDIVNRIKFHYTVALNEALYKSRNQGDFIIESSSKNKYPVHLFVAAAHSPVLREAIKQNKKSYSLEFNDKEVETLITFLYKGSVENLSPENASKILELGDKMGLPGMLHLGQLALSLDINTHNAIQVAVLAKRYQLKSLSLKVFHYIKQNPAILLTNSIDNLNDIDLMKSMLRHVGNPPCRCVKKKESVDKDS